MTICLALLALAVLVVGPILAPRIHMLLVRRTPDPRACATFDDLLPEGWAPLGTGRCPIHGLTAVRLDTVGIGCCQCADAKVGEAR